MSLSSSGVAARVQGAARGVTVEVKRKRVSLLAKKQALQNGGAPADSPGVLAEDVKQALAGGRTLTESELDARLRALKLAQEERSRAEAESEKAAESEKTQEEELKLAAVEEEAPAETKESSPGEPKVSEAVPEPEVSTSKTKQPAVRRKAAPAPEKPVVPIILRAASYGPGQRQLQKEKEQREIKAAESSAARRRTPVEADAGADPQAGIVDPFAANSPRSLLAGRKTRTATSGESERADAANKRGRRELLSGRRKLTRHVITRVMEDGEEERTHSLAAYRRAQKRRLMAGSAGRRMAAKVIRDVVISDAITVGELANRMAVSGGEAVKMLMKMGTPASINQVIDGDTAELLCVEFGHRPKRVSDSDIEIGVERPADLPEDLLPRPPVITVMGHVDHGKTSLLDALKKTDVVATEFGGITQHIGAYQIVTAFSDRTITFLDTPGHAAFSAMRARGASATDIAVIVVAADDSVNAQTVEAIAHAKAANAPIIIAINKMDKKTADPQRIKNELLAQDVLLEEFGGEVMSVEVSAKTGLNLDKLVEAILLQADIMELTANPKGAADGVVIEASVDKGRGVAATVLVQRGTLRPGDIVVAGAEFGKVKRMMDFRGTSVREAGPSYPVEILGFSRPPMAGDKFCVVENEQRAREVAEYRRRVQQEKQALQRNRNSVAHMRDKIADSNIEELAIVLKADVQGSLEAITASIEKLDINGVRAQIIHGAIGDINETDILLAKASDAAVVGFNVKATPQAKSLAQTEGVSFDNFSIIYELLEQVERRMKGMLAPTLEEKDLGKAEVRVVFSKGKVTKIAGCYVTDGLIRRSNAKIRLRRGKDILFVGRIESMRHESDDIKESRENHDCGIIFDGWNDIKEGDIVECFEVVEVRPE